MEADPGGAVSWEAQPEEWIPLLMKAYAFLRGRGVGDLVVYGSQALSLHMPHPLPSKNIDLLGKVSLADVIELSKFLTGRERYEVKGLDDGYVFTVYARTEAGKPLAIEIFTSTPLGPPSALSDHFVEAERWGLKFRTLTPEAYVALKLASPHPLAIRDVEIINASLNYLRLNVVRKILEQAGMLAKAKETIEEAARRGLRTSDALIRWLQS